MPRIVFIGGTHPRHLYYFNRIAEKFDVIGAILEQREGMIPTPPEWCEHLDKALFSHHFRSRDTKETIYFGNQEIEFNHITVDPDKLNTHANAEYIAQLSPDLVLIFGCHMIRNPLLEALQMPAVNLHLGLSPRYRGSATLFWPFYNLEPNHAGCTFHQIVHEPDAGNILHQCRPELKHGDIIHDVACKAVVKATDDMVTLLGDFANWGPTRDWYRQRNTGKCYLTTDFQPQHLRMIYEVFDDDIVDQYLDGKIRPNTDPILHERNLNNV